MRRRAWHVIEAFDLLYSFSNGVPTVVHDGDADAAVPLNLLDADFDTDTLVMPAGRPWTQHTPVLYPICKVRLVRLMRRVRPYDPAAPFPPLFPFFVSLGTSLEEGVLTKTNR